MRRTTALLAAAVLLAGCSAAAPEAGDAAASTPSPARQVHHVTLKTMADPLITDGGGRFGALERDSGELIVMDAEGTELWRARPQLSPDPAEHMPHNWTAAAPFVLADAAHVYLHDGQSGEIRALDWQTGEAAWTLRPPSSPCRGQATMTIRAPERLTDGRLTGLMLTGASQAGTCRGGTETPEGFAIALDPATGQPLGQPLRLTDPAAARGGTFTPDGRAYLQYTSSGDDMVLHRYDLTGGQSAAHDLTGTLGGRLPAGEDVTIEVRGSDELTFFAHDEPDGTRGTFGEAITLESWGAGGASRYEGVVGGGDAGTEVITAPSGAHYEFGLAGAMDDVRLIFRLHDDGTGTGGEQLELPLPDDDFWIHQQHSLTALRGIEDIVMPARGQHGPVVALPGPDWTVRGYDALSGKELWTFEALDDGYPLVEQAAPELGLFAITGSTGESFDTQTALVDARTGEVVETAPGSSIGVDNVFAFEEHPHPIEVRAVSGLR